MALAHVAGLVVVDHQRLHDAEHRLVQGGVDDLAAAGALARVQRHERADRAERRGQRVADGDPGARGHAVGVARDVAQPAHRLADRAVAGLELHRAGLPEAGDAQDDQPRVDLPQLLGGQSPPLERPAAEVLDEHVGGGDDVACDALPLRQPQVAGDGLLVAAEHRPPQRLAAGALLAPHPQRVALVRRLELDDLRAEVGEQLAGERAREQLAHLDDAQVGQRARVGRVAHRSRSPRRSCAGRWSGCGDGAWCGGEARSRRPSRRGRRR